MKSVVLLTVDCLRRDHVSCYGYDRPTTPNIDSVSESGVAFKGYANCPGTRWTFQTLHTGVLTSRINNLGIPEDYTSLADKFRDQGYSTAGFVNNGWVSRDYGFDKGFDRFYGAGDVSAKSPPIKRIGKRINSHLDNNITSSILEIFFRIWRDSNRGESGEFSPSHTDADTVDEVEEWINDQENPYFLWVHFMDAHTPYGYWPDHLRRLRGDTEIEHTIHPGQEGMITVGEEPPQNVIDTYDAGIRSADEQIGRVLELVDEEASIVITGDHGEEFGTFNEFHRASLYSTMADVPIVVRDEDIGSDRAGEVAQHIDIPPTLLRAADIEVPNYWDGIPLQIAASSNDDPVFFALDGQRGVQRGKWKLIQNKEGSTLLKLNKQGEQKEPPSEGPTEELRQMLEDFFGNVQSFTEGYEQSAMSQTTRDNLEDLGYL